MTLLLSPRALDASKGEPARRRLSMKSALRDILETLVLTVVIFLVVQSVVKNFKVEGSSMEPTLHDDEFLLVDKAVYWSLPPALVERLAPTLDPATDGERDFIFHPPQRG